MARALIGKTAGMSLEVELPGGTKVYKILKVEWPDFEETTTKPKP